MNPAPSDAASMPYPSPQFLQATPPRFIRFGSFYLDVRQQELFRENSRVKLQGKVGEALLILVENPGQLVTRENLRLRLWPADTQINHDANVNTTVNKLRQVLGDSPEQPAFVETVPRKGYTFIARVEEVEHSAFAAITRKAATPAQPRDLGPSHRFTSSLPFSSAPVWFTTGVIALLLSGILFGAAVMLYAHRNF